MKQPKIVDSSQFKLHIWQWVVVLMLYPFIHLFFLFCDVVYPITEYHFHGEDEHY